MDLDARIYIAGHRGLVGSALLHGLQREGYRNLIIRTHAELDLEHQPAVAAFFADERPEYVFLAAAKVGGILANATQPVDFLLSNLRIAINVIEASWQHAVAGLLFLGSSCIYPRLAPQPLKEEYVLAGLLETTNEPYALAKLAGLELCEAYNRQYGTRFLNIMPTNLYGPNDHYDLTTSHVLPALIRKFHLGKLAAARNWTAVAADEAVHGSVPADFRAGLETAPKTGQFPAETATAGGLEQSNGPVVRLWGTGSPRREFLFSDDLADACIFLMNHLDDLFAAPGAPSEMHHQAGNIGSAPSSPPRRRPAPPLARLKEPHALAARHLINVGSGEDLTIRELAAMVARIVGHHGPIEWDVTKPDGTPRKLLAPTRILQLGWKPKTGLEDGIHLAYQDYLNRGRS